MTHGLVPPGAMIGDRGELPAHTEPHSNLCIVAYILFQTSPDIAHLMFTALSEGSVVLDCICDIILKTADISNNYDGKLRRHTPKAAFQDVKQ